MYSNTEIKQRHLMYDFLNKFGEGTSIEICDYIISTDDSLFKPGLTLEEKRKSVSGSLSKAYSSGQVKRKKSANSNTYVYYK